MEEEEAKRTRCSRGERVTGDNAGEKAHRKGACGVEGCRAGLGKARDVLQGTRREPGKHFGGECKSVVVDADIRESKPASVTRVTPPRAGRIRSLRPTNHSLRFCDQVDAHSAWPGARANLRPPFSGTGPGGGRARLAPGAALKGQGPPGFPGHAATRSKPGLGLARALNCRVSVH